MWRSQSSFDVYIFYKSDYVIPKLVFKHIIKNKLSLITCVLCIATSMSSSDIICLNKTLILFKHKFYQNFVDDIFKQYKKYVENILFKKRNNYHRKIKLNFEIIPTIF